MIKPSFKIKIQIWTHDLIFVNIYKFIYTIILLEVTSYKVVHSATMFY